MTARAHIIRTFKPSSLSRTRLKHNTEFPPCGVLLTADRTTPQGRLRLLYAKGGVVQYARALSRGLREAPLPRGPGYGGVGARALARRRWAVGASHWREVVGTRGGMRAFHARALAEADGWHEGARGRWREAVGARALAIGARALARGRWRERICSRVLSRLRVRIALHDGIPCNRGATGPVSALGTRRPQAVRRACGERAASVRRARAARVCCGTCLPDSSLFFLASCSSSCSCSCSHLR